MKTELEKAMRELRFPHPKKTTRDLHFYMTETSASWSKYRGHGGRNTVDRVFETARNLKWKEPKREVSASPDGNYVSTGLEFISPDGKWKLNGSRSYGVVAADNSFSLRLQQVKQ